MNTNQLRLISRISFYMGIQYRYKKPPPDNILDNDYKLDRWILEQKANERSERAKNSTKDNENKRGPRDSKDEFDSTQIIQ